MKDKINVAELLKDCPKGMELDCTMYENVYFERVDKYVEYPIMVRVGETNIKYLTEEGCCNTWSNAKCVIFPKGKTTWEGFHRPFKDGDIAASNDGLFIGIVKYIDENCIYAHCAISKVGNLTKNCPYYLHRFATEEEKEKLFKAIKENGYKWNEETKTLEMLVEPKFKVGDRIVHKKEGNPFTITEITDGCYKGGTRYAILITQQDNFELVQNKFDINTLVPFESRVLVRSECDNLWKPAIFGFYLDNGYAPYFAVGGFCWEKCIPYEGNEHLLGTTDDCDEYYKTWE